MSRPTDRDVFLPVGAQPSIDALCEQAERAEELGYDRVWLPETWGRDAVTVLTSIAHRTDEIGIGTSIVPIYSRSPRCSDRPPPRYRKSPGGAFGWVSAPPDRS